ncbi:MAG: flavodoxin family protein [Candidatus Aerophobetes bacterium]|nr:flavodoxin family protein [Candidatus Aerophobetes bacterium]
MKARSLILYASWTGNTKIVAENIAKGLKRKKIEAEVKNIKEAKLKDVEPSDILIVGSATHGGKALRSVKSFFEKLPEDALKNKIGASFAVHGGRGGEKVVEEIKRYFIGKSIKSVRLSLLIAAGVPLLPIRRPKEADLRKCEDFGGKIAEQKR